MASIHQRVTEQIILLRSQGKHPSRILVGLTEQQELLGNIEWIMPHQWITVHPGNSPREDTLFGCIIDYLNVSSKLEVIAEEDIDNFAYIKWRQWLKEGRSGRTQK